jgi:AraC-like DNA-binding protein
MKDYGQAILYLNKSLSFSSNRYADLESYDYLIKCYTALNDTKNAIKYYENVKKVKDSITNVEKEASANLRNEEMSKSEALINSNKIAYTMLIIVLISTIIFIFVYSRKRKKQLDNPSTELSNSIMLVVDPKTDQKKETAESNKKSEELYKEIINHFDKNKCYRDHDYSMTSLAMDLNTNIVYISQAINKNSNMNFKNFLNKYRVDEVKKRLQEHEHETFTLEYIYKSSGFSNQTTFNRAFKEIENVIPKQYIEKINHPGAGPQKY